jgi:hypothetical protein
MTGTIRASAFMLPARMRYLTGKSALTAIADVIQDICGKGGQREKRAEHLKRFAVEQRHCEGKPISGLAQGVN